MKNTLIYAYVPSREMETSTGFVSIKDQYLLCEMAMRKVRKYKLADNPYYYAIGQDSDKENRDGFKLLLRRIETDSSIKAVYVHDISRAARNIEECAEVKKTLAKRGVEIVSTITPTITPSFINALFEIMGKHESAMMSERSKRAWAIRKAKQTSLLYARVSTCPEA